MGKSHYSRKNRKIQHDLNTIANETAGKHLDSQDHRTGTNACQPSYPGYKVRLLRDDCIIASNYYTTISQGRHDKQLRDYILKRTKWSYTKFNLVHWSAHGTAFKRLTRAQQITMAKLIHNLANTNRQNFLYYTTSPLCPGCVMVEETFEHVLRCSLPQTVAYCNLQLNKLVLHLHKIQTPLPVIHALQKGFHDWLNQTTHCSRAHTYGSLFGPDILLTSAYYEQYHQLGWFQLCLGRISKTWSKAVSSYGTPTLQTDGD
jgi:hypothetical protein